MIVAISSPHSFAKKKAELSPIPIMNILILFATQMGNAESVAGSFSDYLSARGHPCEVANVATLSPQELAHEDRPIVFCASTWGEGDPPDDAVDFWEQMADAAPGSLSRCTFAVYALGDRNYDEFCGFGRKLDQRMEELGATRLIPRVENDVEYDEHLLPFAASLCSVLDTAEENASPARLTI